MTVTREMIRTYADLTGDHTPIHVDASEDEGSEDSHVAAAASTAGRVEFP